MGHSRRRVRPGRFHTEYALMLALILAVCLGGVFSLAHVEPDTWLWESGSAFLWACLSFLLFVVLLATLTFLIFFGLFAIDLARARSPGARGVLIHDFRVFTVLFFACVFLLLVLVLALPLVILCIPFWLVALTLEGIEAFRRAQTARRLARLGQLGQQGNGRTTASHLRFTVKLLNDRDSEVRQKAFKTTACLMRYHREAVLPAWRPILEKALSEQVSFTRSVSEMGQTTPLATLVTLGAKLGAGTAEKRISPATSDPVVLAAWLKREQEACKLPAVGEVQVSIGYDSGALPCQEQRGRFLALFLFIGSTDLKKFQALTRRPPRDPNAAFGLLIRGDRVEVLYPGQCSGRRLDYVFPYPAAMTEVSLTEFLRQFQLLNLGLLLASAEESHRMFFPGESPPWMDGRCRAVAATYRVFERRLVAWLRRHDGYRDPEMIFPLNLADHRERQEAFRQFHLEECLYPQYSWVVPLYGEDESWDQLLPALRAVEGMMLHQGPMEGQELTRGAAFIRGLRLLGWLTANAIDEILTETEPTPPATMMLDPFIDAENEEGTRHYLRAMTKGIQRGQVTVEALPDTATFRGASAYYRVEEAEAIA